MADAVGGAPPAAGTADDSSAFQSKLVLKHLDKPCGLALRPGSPDRGPYELFLAEGGAGRVAAFPTSAPDALREVITGFPRTAFGSEGSYELGPLSLMFLTRTKLAVGGGGLEESRQVVAVFSIPDDRQPLSADQAEYGVGSVKVANRLPDRQGSFFGIARNDGALLVASSGEEGPGSILRASIDANRLSVLKPLIPASKLTDAPNPMGLVINPKPGFGYLVAGHMGAPSNVHDSRLVFYSPQSGRVALDLELDLYDVFALAYSPSGNLYAADFSWADPPRGGIFRIEEDFVDGRQVCRPVRVASAVHPTSLIFTPDGTLWVTTFEAGEFADDEPGRPQGSLLRIEGEF